MRRVGIVDGRSGRAGMMEKMVDAESDLVGVVWIVGEVVGGEWMVGCRVGLGG